jgi:regulator of nucleoside diphosphate kinase
MTDEKATPRPTSRRPRIIVSETTLAHLEGLVDGAMQRNPALAERLLEELGRAKVVPANKLPANVVSIGNAVTYRNEATGQEQTVTLVFPEDADITTGRVSVMTPIGTALLGLAEGAAFYWDTRDNQRRMLTVTKVEPAKPDDPER